ncbi:MAG: hypothetical protein ACLFQX_00750 [Candidatus Kapaibacterium sp.]
MNDFFNQNIGEENISRLRKWHDENPGYLGGIAALGVLAIGGALWITGADISLDSLDFTNMDIGAALDSVDGDVLGWVVWIVMAVVIPFFYERFKKSGKNQPEDDPDNSVILKDGKFKDL